MPLDHQMSLATQAALFNGVAEGLDAQDIVAAALAGPWAGRVAVVSSFGADAVALLHLVSRVDRSAPVLFVDTRLLFEETLSYQLDVAQHLGLSDVRVLRARHLDITWHDTKGDLHKTDPDACCALRKTAPLNAALDGFDAWMTGRKRFQSGSRADLSVVEEADGRLKINPLAKWSADDIADHINTYNLPRHPLVAKGYPSIGCTPCTSKVRPGEDPRAGRWRGQDKEECGIHIIDGRIVRSPINAGDRP